MFKRYWWILLVMFPVGMMAGFMVAAVVTYVMPKMYESTATLEIRPHMQLRSGGMTPTFVATEFEKIKSRNSLSKVVESLDLTSRWGLDQESALQVLKGIVQTQNISGTDLIQIRVRHTNKEDARDIAAEVARVYRDFRKEMVSRSLEAGISELKNAVREQEDKVEEKRKILMTIFRTKGVGEGSDPADVQDYAAAKRDFESELSLLERMKLKLISVEIDQGISGETIVVHDDPVIAHSPISPNVTLNLVIGLIGGGVLSLFLALPMMWWMSRRGGMSGAV